MKGRFKDMIMAIELTRDKNGKYDIWFHNYSYLFKNFEINELELIDKCTKVMSDMCSFLVKKLKEDFPEFYKYEESKILDNNAKVKIYDATYFEKRLKKK